MGKRRRISYRKRVCRQGKIVKIESCDKTKGMWYKIPHHGGGKTIEMFKWNNPRRNHFAQKNKECTVVRDCVGQSKSIIPLLLPSSTFCAC